MSGNTAKRPTCRNSDVWTRRSRYAPTQFVDDLIEILCDERVRPLRVRLLPVRQVDERPLLSFRQPEDGVLEVPLHRNRYCGMTLQVVSRRRLSR